MTNTSRLNRILNLTSFRVNPYPYYSQNNLGYNTTGVSVNGNHGLYSKFLKVKVRNADGTFELPICSQMSFYEGIMDFVAKKHENLASSNESYEVLAPIHCNNVLLPYRTSTVESAFMDVYTTTLPFGVTRVDVGLVNNPTEVKATFYQAPGLLLDEHFNPLLYLTIRGQYKANNDVEYQECRVYVAHRVFIQADPVSKFILKKVLPFYLFNRITIYPFSTNPTTGINPTDYRFITSQGDSVKAKVILDPLDNLITSVKTPESYTNMEQDIYTKLKTPGALSEMFDPDRMFI